MVALLTKTELQALNIDTVEKALVFSALVLRSALVGDDNANTSNLAVSINVSALDDTQGNLNLEVNIPYSAYQLNTKGGQLLDSILEYSSNASNLENDLNLESIPTTSGLIIPDYDEIAITSFEKYLVYYAQILWASLENKQDSTISFTFLSNQEEPQLLISINLPLNLNQWLLGGNYLDALFTVVTSYVDPNPAPGGGDSQEEIVNYYYSLDGLAAYNVESLHTVTNPGVLEQITIDADYATETGFLDTYFYLNGTEIYPEEIFDYGDGSYDLVFDTVNNPIFLESGDHFEFEIYEEPEPTYMDINLYINELLAQP